jgi:hypothetical protein
MVEGKAMVVAALWVIPARSARQRRYIDDEQTW